MAKRKAKVTSTLALRMLCVQLASAAIFMQPKFRETALFRRFAESDTGKLLQKKGKSVDAAITKVHEELLHAGLVALSEKARTALARDGAGVVKAALKAYLETVEHSLPAEMRADVLARHPQYQQAKSLFESMS